MFLFNYITQTSYLGVRWNIGGQAANKTQFFEKITMELLVDL